MFRGLDLLLVLMLMQLCFVHESRTTLLHVTGKKGGSVTLTCEFEAKEIFDIVLSSLSKNIPVCEKKNCSGRVFKEGSCDVIITDLIYSDAERYFLRVYYTNDQSKLDQRITEYHLHIHDEISVKKGEDLKLDVLLINADKVERNSSSAWTELWTRGHGVNSDRLTVSDETLIIHEFTDTDTGTYRVLDSNNQTWITVTVTESEEKQNTNVIRTNSGEQPVFWIVTVGTIVFMLIICIIYLIITAVIRCLHVICPVYRVPEPKVVKVSSDNTSVL